LRAYHFKSLFCPGHAPLPLRFPVASAGFSSKSIPFVLIRAFHRLSLRARLSVGAVTMVLLTTFGITLAALTLVKVEMQAAIAGEQLARLSALADAVDQKFASRRILLRSVRETAEAEEVASPAELQAFLGRHASLSGAFANLFFLDVKGDLLATVLDPDRAGTINLADRDYFRHTLAARAGVISRPLRNRISGLPQVQMTEPILDAGGRVRALLVASINLQDKAFLGPLADVRFGSSGYLFILDTQGTVIYHPRASRILKARDVEGGSNLAEEKAMAGFEGTTEAVNRYGVDGLYAFKRIQETDWVLGAIYPRTEAFAPLASIQRAALAGACLLAALAGSIALWTLRRTLSPLTRLHDRMLDARDGAPDMPPGGDEIGDLALTFDALMAERRGAEGRLQESERYLRSILAHAGDAFIAVDRHGAVAEWNHQAELTFGWPRDEAVGRSLAGLIIPPGMRGAHEQGMHLFAGTGKGPVINTRIEVHALHRDGRTIPVELSVASVDMGDHFVAYAFLRDITAPKALEAQLRQLARVDTLTELPNRLAFNELLPVAVARARRTSEAMALMFLDIDYFKGINDSLGHVGGDLVLIEFARRLRASVRTTDTVARLAGDEFVVVLENLGGQEAAEAVAAKIVAQVGSLPFDLDGRELEVTTSVGVVLHRPLHEPGDGSDLLARADAALYDAKGLGRNRYHFAA
jgi:diguanylate cyclase (GGDEF)-like protein/PAS domain S-box-containing protein